MSCLEKEPLSCNYRLCVTGPTTMHYEIVFATLAVLIGNEFVSAQQIPSTTTPAEMWNPWTWFWPYAIASAEAYRDYYQKAQKATNELYQQIYKTNAFPWVTGNWGPQVNPSGGGVSGGLNNPTGGSGGSGQNNPAGGSGGQSNPTGGSGGSGQNNPAGGSGGQNNPTGGSGGSGQNNPAGGSGGQSNPTGGSGGSGQSDPSGGSGGSGSGQSNPTGGSGSSGQNDSTTGSGGSPNAQVEGSV